MERRVYGHEELAEREPDHRLTATTGRRHGHRRQLDHKLMRAGVHEHRRTGQRFGTGAGAPGEQEEEEENGPHAGWFRSEERDNIPVELGLRDGLG